MSEAEVDELTTLQELKSAQNKERKDLLAKIISLKHSVKNDKKRKKEVAQEVEILERELKLRHEAQLNDLEQSLKSLELPKVQVTSNPEISAKNGEDSAKIGENQSQTEGPGPKDKKPSKAQIRRDKKNEQAKQRAAAMSQAVAEDEHNAQFSQAKIEADEMEKVLDSRRLRLVEIPPDGDCLFNAVTHQINWHEPKSKFSCADLRRMAAEFIEANKEEFLPFLADNKGNPLDEFEFEEYCSGVRKMGNWGGEPELRALSASLQRRIEVLHANGQVNAFGENTSPRKLPLTVTFHRFAYTLGEHYNSTAPASKLIE